MNTARIRQLNKKIDKLLNTKNVVIFPIMGGLSMGDKCRNVTSEEAEILEAKGMPIPISISLNREQEFLEVLKA